MGLRFGGKVARKKGVEFADEESVEASFAKMFGVRAVSLVHEARSLHEVVDGVDLRLRQRGHVTGPPLLGDAEKLQRLGVVLELDRAGLARQSSGLDQLLLKPVHEPRALVDRPALTAAAAAATIAAAAVAAAAVAAAAVAAAHGGAAGTEEREREGIRFPSSLLLLLLVLLVLLLMRCSGAAA